MFFRQHALFYLFLVALNTVSAQQIAINEVMASNSTTIFDEDGDFSDWIELYNYGTEPVSLMGFGLSDNLNSPFKWVFPDVIIDPGSFLLVWASGKDRHPESGALANGLIREVYDGIQGGAVSDLINHPDYPENPSSQGVLRNLFEAPVNIGDYYGQRIHGWIKAPVTGQYTFWISGDDNCELHLSTSASPNNTRLIASVPGWTEPREWNKYGEQRSSPVYLIKDVYYYVKALMKEHAGGDHLAVGWQIPGGNMERPISGTHLFSGQAQLHTNFSISAEGEDVILVSPDSITISQMAPVAMASGISRGRFPDGTGEWFYFDLPTPGSSNSTEAYTELLDPPQFSENGGFFNNAFDLTVTHPDKDVQIIYTLDGSLPDARNLEGINYLYKNQYPQNASDPVGPFLTNTFQSFLYSEPVRIYDRSAENDKLSQISTTWQRVPSYLPTTPVKKGIVIRTRAEKPGAVPSQTVTNSFFYGNEEKNPFALPVISLSLQEDALFEYHNGIYVAGQVFDNWRTNNPGANADGGTTANYWLGGDATERLAHIEYFEKDASEASLSQDIGVRLHGGWSRAHPLKSLRLYARGEYGTSTFDHAIFPGLPYNSYKRLVLRNSGNDYYSTYIRDAAIHRIMSPLHFDTQAWQPAIVFINGEYWGIHNIRERFDKHYLARVYGLDAENIDLLENYAGIIEGDSDHYNAMINFITISSPSEQTAYAYLETQMDMSGFADYQIANIFAANTDWPGNNIKFWRLKKDQYDPAAPYGHDGRWRWLMYDTDFGFGLVPSPNHNTLQFAADPIGPGWPNPPWSTFLFRKLLENAAFKQYFINRFADLLNTSLLTTRMVSVIHDMQAIIEPEMPEHMQRWRGSAGGSMNSWNYQVNGMVNFANLRPLYVRSHIRTFFNIGGSYTLSLNVRDNQAGYIRVNTVPIVKGTPGVADAPYPWTGIYFNGIPIEVEAIAAKGFVFSHWEGGAGGSNGLLKIQPAANISLTAHFTKSSVVETELVHHWHFNSLPTSTLIAVPADYSALSHLIGNILYPGSGDGYMDSTNGTTVNAWAGTPAGNGLRVRNPSDTRALVIQVPSVGYKDLELSFAVHRTTTGASQQQLYYSSDGGLSWNSLGDSYVIEQEYMPHQVDLSGIGVVNNNPGLQFRIEFLGDEAAGDSGNNRFDNILLKGTPMHTDITERQEGNFDVQISPNPAKHAFTFSISAEMAVNGTLNLYRLNGGLVRKVKISQSHTQVPVGDLKPGVYIVSYDNINYRIVRRLIKY